MKNMTTLNLFILLFGTIFTAAAQDFTEKVTKTANFGNQNYLKIYNLQGSVSVEGYNGDEIQIEAVKKVWTQSDGDEQLAKEELKLLVDEEDELVLVYIETPFVDVIRKGDRISYNSCRPCGGYHDDDDKLNYQVDISVKVPRNSRLHASTVNRGIVMVQNTRGELSVSNVNGEIELKEITGTTRAHTVNGDITASYLDSPDEDSEYKTVNGRIEVLYPKNLSADIYFKSLNGHLYTDFKEIKHLKSVVRKNENSRRGSVTYKIDKFSPVRIGEGGPKLSFNVLNGNVYVKQIQS